MAQYIYGRNPVMEWLNAGMSVSQLYLAGDLHGPTMQQLDKLLRQKKIPVKKSDKAELTRLVGHDKHQGIVARISAPQYYSLDEILARAKAAQEPPLIAVLDGVQDPHNLGAIIRSADGAGIHGIIIPKDNAVELTPAVLKASAGAAAHVPVARVTNIARVLNELKEKGFWVSGVDQDGDKPYDQADYSGPTVLVLGSEGRGIRRLVRDTCDFIISIPMHGKVNSLNVSVASALVFFQARLHRSRGNKGSK